jgi:phosphatidylinositol alpha-1,6-mannosyltransferase
MVTPNFPPDIGGTQTYAFELAKEFASRCGDFAVLAPRRRGGSQLDTQHSIEVIRGFEPGDNFALSGKWHLARILKRRQFNVLFCTHWSAAYSALKARADEHQLVVCAAHGREIQLRPFARMPILQRQYDRIRRTALAASDKFFPVSRYTGGLLRDAGVDQEKVAVVNNGVDPVAFTPAPTGAADAAGPPKLGKRLLTVARLVPRKGIDRVIASLAKIRAAVPGTDYVVAGFGPDRARLGRLAEEHGVSEHVHFVGKVDHANVVEYYRACDLFLLPASSVLPDIEGFGLAFLEASACGKPVIGSSAGGIPDAVLNDQTGLIVDLADANGISDAVVRILLDDGLSQRLGQAGREHVIANGSWAACSQAILDHVLQLR